jgi:hypothetical protein
LQPVTEQSRAQHWRPIVGGGFHLEHSRRAQVLLALAAFAAGDAIYQQVASPLRLVSAGVLLWLLLVVTALAVLALGRWWLMRGAVPTREALGIAAAFALALSASNYHTVQWLEVATDPDGAQGIFYQRDAAAGVVFRPMEGDGPRIVFRRDLDYWDNLDRSRPYAFQFYRGWSRSWVLDETPLRADIALHRSFFRSVEPQP